MYSRVGTLYTECTAHTGTGIEYIIPGYSSTLYIQYADFWEIDIGGGGGAAVSVVVATTGVLFAWPVFKLK